MQGSDHRCLLGDHGAVWTCDNVRQPVDGFNSWACQCGDASSAVVLPVELGTPDLREQRCPSVDLHPIPVPALHKRCGRIYESYRVVFRIDEVMPCRYGRTIGLFSGECCLKSVSMGKRHCVLSFLCLVGRVCVYHLFVRHAFMPCLSRRLSRE